MVPYGQEIASGLLTTSDPAEVKEASVKEMIKIIFEKFFDQTGQDVLEVGGGKEGKAGTGQIFQITQQADDSSTEEYDEFGKI